MTTFYDRVFVAVSLSGSAFVPGDAVSGYLGFDEVTAGDSVPYVVEDGSAWEIGHAVWDGESLTRTVERSSLGVGEALTSLTHRARLSVTALGSDLAALAVADDVQAELDGKADADLTNVSGADFAAVPFSVDGGTETRPLRERFRLSTDDFASLAAAVAAGGAQTLKAGTHESAAALTLTGSTDLRGDGRFQSEIQRTGTGFNLLSAGSADNLVVSDLSLDMNFRGGKGSGHGVAIAESDNVLVRNVRVRDFGNAGGSAGTGVLAYSSAGTIENVVFEGVQVDGETATSTDTNGTLIVNGRYCRQSGVFAKNIVQYAVELKNDARYSLVGDSIAYNAGYGFGYGQDTVGVDGCDLNVATGLIAAACDSGFVIGEGNYNVVSGMVIDSTGRPSFIASGGVGVRVDQGGAGGGVGNWFTGVLTYGANMTYPVRTDASRNVFEVASHDTASKIASFTAGAAGNHVRIVHPGARTSIASAIDDASGNATNGTSANTVDSPHTREYFGSVSGKFHWKLASYGGTLPSHQYAYENNGSISVAYGVPGSNGQVVYPAAIHTPTVNNYAVHGYQFGASAGADYWLWKVGNAFKLRLFTTTLRPETDNDLDIGTASVRIKATYSRELRPGAGAVIWTSGAGTPEGSVTAPVGSLYTRTDGGAGTVLYVKETGAGNTGWAAK